MDPSLLHKFRQQLSSWIEERLAIQRLPFQRLELCPRILTDRGRLAPDMVLWINRDSQLAGSMILLPDQVDDQCLAEGIALGTALGLGHFTTWAAREVTVWQIGSGGANRQHTSLLPPANQVTPDDFQQTLIDLLERLKVISVTSALTTEQLTVYYFANLCLRNLQDLAPGLTISARLAAGQTAADEWLESAPRSKAWMSLWRILFLLWRDQIPPGLQPERLELAIGYALSDQTGGVPNWLEILASEPPLPEGDAVRLHHLASRLRQLGWPKSTQQAEELIGLLVDEAGHRFGLETPCLPWRTDHVQRWMSCQPSSSARDCSLVAPRAYLAGWILKSSSGQMGLSGKHAEDLSSLNATQKSASAIAVLHDKQPLERRAREARLILLRQAWPSRRFELPRATPAWLWDALCLAGLTSEDLTLVLPEDWSRTPGVMSLWTTLAESYQLTEIADSETGAQALHFVRSTIPRPTILFHRHGQTLEIERERLSWSAPGTTQAWLKGSNQLVDLLQRYVMRSLDAGLPAVPEVLTWGLHLFLHTGLGGHLWDLCSGRQELPEFTETLDAVRCAGVPVPNETVLLDLGMLGSFETAALPDTEVLEREFAHIFGDTPALPENSPATIPDTPRARRRSSAPAERIAAKVFVDGIPRFPEHYLMHVYRPRLVHYQLCGPLEISGEFFGRVTLRTINKEHTLEVCSQSVAEALVLASHNGSSAVALPEEEPLLAELVSRYLSDLQRLWRSLVMECRRYEPHRLAAVKLARKIWQQKGLPPQDVTRRR